VPEWVSRAGVRRVEVASLPGWRLRRPSTLARWRWLRGPVSFVVEELFRAYFHSRSARRLLDGLGLAHFYMQSPLYRLPPTEARQALLAAVGGPVGPRLLAQSPVLIEHWGSRGRSQIHLVNYAAQPQTVTVKFGRPLNGRVLGLEGQDARFAAESLTLSLDTYAIILED